MGAEAQISRSLINRIYAPLANEFHFATPLSSLRTNELDLVRGVLRMLQGFSGSLFSWDNSGNRFRAKSGIYVSHLSQNSLHSLLNQFIHAATCLQLVDITLNRVETAVPKPPPTLKAFASSASAWLKRLRNIALKEEVSTSNADGITTPTLLGLANSLSSLCSGAGFLLRIVHEAIPAVYFEVGASVPAAELAVHVLDYLHKKLDEMCLVEGGEEEAYQMVLYMYFGSLLPYIEGLDSWLFEGILNDPSEEMFFFTNKEVSVDEAEFWERSYLLRMLQHVKFDSEFSSMNYASDSVSASNDKKEMDRRDSIPLSSTTKGKEQNTRGHPACPFFIKDLAKSIVSAGKSLQLMCHVPNSSAACSKGSNCETGSTKYLNDGLYPSQRLSGLTLSEVFSVSLAGLVGHGDHVFKYFWQNDWYKSVSVSSVVSHVNEESTENDNNNKSSPPPYSEKTWYKFLIDTLFLKGSTDLKLKYKGINSDTRDLRGARVVQDEVILLRSYVENPVITVCQMNLGKNGDALKTLNLSQKFCLPSLNDEGLRKAIFGGESTAFSDSEGTNYTFGFQFGESEYLRSQDERNLLGMLFPFPTILPLFQNDLPVSELLPFQRNSSLPSRVLRWMQNVDLRTTPLPLVIMQYCLTVYIQKQVEYIGVNMLLKLMNEWRLMDELAVLRAIYLLGSGDLLQHFLTVIFNKLDKGETWDDDFELNTILQESIRNSADCMLLSAPDSLVVSITKSLVDSDEEASTSGVVLSTHKSHISSFGINGLDMLKFTYKVPWPLELIANTEAIKKYNQVMRFLLKVKRAKFVLDKVRRWMWKDRGSITNDRKHHWLVEQKLLHFVDAFHQYVMDRVYHSAWRELCEGMTAAKSLDEVIEVHEAYILSIQRQCFVVPDKLGALIASRINSILGIALDFYIIQQTLSSGGAVSAIKARCEMEVDRIEKQFDECIAFLLRVLSFKLNVGHFPHLADLVTRINHNYFYMSPNGNLMTASGSGSVTSRMGKAPG
ncbi:gamma-tubulin complex component 5 [Abrus precatorius]|uniref:Gamma-tubulin complex component n=1 Tax=Abrus precatorius TaxID=3816 RepID=A0A8B8LFX2_ABRPR|nr:gamma-tubulin complex component 5 [Abrus precatorius]XP_027354209.1 gamma-tubulin complex component 5 [Abrus precatorius]